MKILVTGGCGFIGSHLVDRLIALGHEVQDLDYLTYAGDAVNTIRDKKTYIHIYKKVQDAKLRHVFDPIDVIYHLAAESAVDKSNLDPNGFTETNVVGTFNMLMLAKALKVKKFIQISTDEVLGHLKPNDPPFMVNSPIMPRNIYSATKAAGEHIARAFVNVYDLPVIIVRSCNAYGPHQQVEKFIPRAITKVLSGQKIPLYGTGENIREWIYVTDLVAGLTDLLNIDATGQTVHFSSSEEKTNKEIAETIANELNGEIEHVADRKAHDERYALTPTDEFKTKTKFEDGLLDTINWYKNNLDWWKRSIQKCSAAW